MVGWTLCLFWLHLLREAYPVHSSASASALPSPPPPVISPDFMVNITENDDTNTTILQEQLAIDIHNHRSYLYAYGTLVHGALEQIRRCDLHPTGWYSSAGGPNISDPSSWECTNTSISLKDELPNSCQWSDFWDLPPDMKYVGAVVLNGIKCDEWQYTNGGSLYGFWARYSSPTVKAADIPVATGRLESISGSPYMLFFNDFVAGSPPLSAFDPIPGTNCPAATPPTILRPHFDQTRDSAALQSFHRTLE